jgi:hypothetical protein
VEVRHRYRVDGSLECRNGAAPEVADPPGEDRIRDQPDAVQLDQDCAVSEPGQPRLGLQRTASASLAALVPRERLAPFVHLPYFDELEAERLDLLEHPVQR